jgi:hypothetical protein
MDLGSSFKNFLKGQSHLETRMKEKGPPISLGKEGKKGKPKTFQT